MKISNNKGPKKPLPQQQDDSRRQIFDLESGRSPMGHGAARKRTRVIKRTRTPAHAQSVKLVM